MEPPSNASRSSALHWLAEGFRRRTVLKFYFEIWYLADAPHYALLQAQDSASLSTVPFELSPGVFCLGTKAQVQRSEHSMRKASRLAEALSSMRVERIRFLKRLFLGWHSVVLLEVHIREMVATARTAPHPIEPEGEPDTPRCIVFADLLMDLRALFRVVVFLPYSSIRALRAASRFSLSRTSTAQQRPNYFLMEGRPALLWHRGMELPVIICIAQPSPGDEYHPRSIVQCTARWCSHAPRYFDFFLHIGIVFQICAFASLASHCLALHSMSSLATVLQCLMSSGPEERVAAFKGLTVHQLALLQDDIRAALLNVDTGRAAPASSSDAPAGSSAPRPAQPAAPQEEEEDEDYAPRRHGRDYDDDWDRGAPSTAPRGPTPAPAPPRRGGFPPARQSYDDYDRHRAETERIWANADFDEPDRYWSQPQRPRPATWSDRPRAAPHAQDDWAYAQAAGYGAPPPPPQPAAQHGQHLHPARPPRIDRPFYHASGKIRTELRWVQCTDGVQRPMFQHPATRKPCCAQPCDMVDCPYGHPPCQKPLRSPPEQDLHETHRCSKCKEDFASPASQMPGTFAIFLEELSTEVDFLWFNAQPELAKLQELAPASYCTAMLTLRWAATLPWQQPGQGLHSAEARQLTLRSMKSTALASAAQLRMEKELRLFQGHHRDSADLYSRNDVFASLDVQHRISKSLASGWRAERSIARGGQAPIPEPPFFSLPPGEPVIALPAEALTQGPWQFFVTRHETMLAQHGQQSKGHALQEQVSPSQELTLASPSHGPPSDVEADMVERAAMQRANSLSSVSSSVSSTASQINTPFVVRAEFSARFACMGPWGMWHALSLDCPADQTSRTACGMELGIAAQVSEFPQEPFCRRKACVNARRNAQV
ncbi:unnamed protein product [Symbiodinium microadriaticum]|nr:unnamed protein product [Symbiodinium microadriaticum]